MPCDTYRNDPVAEAYKFPNPAHFNTDISQYLETHIPETPQQAYSSLPEQPLASAGGKQEGTLLCTGLAMLWGALATNGVMLTQSIPC